MDKTSQTDSMFNVETIATVALAGVAVYYFFVHRSKKSPEFDIKYSKNFILDQGRSNSISETSFVERMRAKGRNVIIFYGSQTGTAEEFSSRLSKDSALYGMKALVADPEEVDMDDLAHLHEIENSFAIFCLATYGEGDPTDNAIEFNDWLKSTNTDLNGLKYAVFALGNRTYEHFNSFGKFVDKKLSDLGAQRIHPIGLGDDDANIDEDFVTWREQFWNSVCELFQVEASTDLAGMRQYELEVHEDIDPDRVFTGEVSRLKSLVRQRPPFDLKNPFLAPILTHKELYKGDRSCMHIELSLADSKIRYEAGDHVAVYPENQESLVEKLGQLCGADLSAVISLKNLDTESSKRYLFPCPCSYRTALKYYVDITQNPRPHVLKELAEYASDPQEKQKLITMSSNTEEGKALYHQYVLKGCRNIVEILEDMTSVKIPLDHLLELCPRLQARFYSISSSPKVNNDSLTITAVLSQFNGHDEKPRFGIATGYLRSMKGIESPRVPVFIRRSQFKLPARPQTPIIMIGPGTGFAPFRGFLQERDWLKNEGKPIGSSILYFGCRKRSEDYLYEHELDDFLQRGVLSKLYTAFSRDQPEKIYVSHLLKQNKAEIWQVIGVENGHIYICGDARSMAKDVREIIINVVMEFGELNRQGAEDYIKKMETQRRYSSDVWS